MPCSFPRLTSALLVLVASVQAAEPPPPAGSPPAAFSPETYAAVGSAFAQNTRLAELGWTEAQFNAFLDGVRATFQGRPRALDAQARLLHDAIGLRVQALVAQEARARQDHFADPARLAAYMKDVAKTFKLQIADSGLAFGLVSRGGGARPGPDDSVVVSYNAVAADAKTELPALSVKQHRIKVAELLPGLAEGIQMMTMGSSAILVLPPDLSYGGAEWPPDVARGTPLIFTVALHEISAAP